MTLGQLKDVHPVAWLGLAVALGAFALAYHSYTKDEADTDWTTAKEEQPPMRAPYPDVPGNDHACRPMATCCGFRQRAYPASLVDASFSFIGEI